MPTCNLLSAKFDKIVCLQMDVTIRNTTCKWKSVQKLCSRTRFVSQQIYIVNIFNNIKSPPGPPNHRRPQGRAIYS